MVRRYKRVMVTGGAGFVGSHLVEVLVKKNYQVTVVDNLAHGDKRRVAPEANLIVKDIRDKHLVKVFKKYRPEIVYHLAAQQDVAVANKNPLLDAAVNILGTINILECCGKSGVKRIIYADSVAGFGEPKRLPIKADEIREPRSFYGISKHTVEHYLQAYQKWHKLKFIGLVLANVYGPRQDPSGEGGVVAIFADRMVKNQSITINGDGEQTRDFVYVKDVVTAMIRAEKYGANQFLMVGTGRKTSVNQLFKIMSQMTGYKKRPKYGPPRIGDVKHSLFSIAKTKSVLQWQFEYELGQGVEDYFRFLTGGKPMSVRLN